MCYRTGKLKTKTLPFWAHWLHVIWEKCTVYKCVKCTTSSNVVPLCQEWVFCSGVCGVHPVWNSWRCPGLWLADTWKGSQELLSEHATSPTIQSVIWETVMMPLKQVNEGMEAWVINRCVLFVFHWRKQGDWTTAQIDTCDATKYPENKMKHGEYRAKKYGKQQKRRIKRITGKKMTW